MAVASPDFRRSTMRQPSSGLAGRVRAAAGGPVDAVFDVAGKTPVQDLIGKLVLVP